MRWYPFYSRATAVRTSCSKSVPNPAASFCEAVAHQALHASCLELNQPSQPAVKWSVVTSSLEGHVMAKVQRPWYLQSNWGRFALAHRHRDSVPQHSPHPWMSHPSARSGRSLSCHRRFQLSLCKLMGLHYLLDMHLWSQFSTCPRHRACCQWWYYWWQSSPPDRSGWSIVSLRPLAAV